MITKNLELFFEIHRYGYFPTLKYVRVRSSKLLWAILSKIKDLVEEFTLRFLWKCYLFTSYYFCNCALLCTYSYTCVYKLNSLPLWIKITILRTHLINSFRQHPVPEIWSNSFYALCCGRPCSAHVWLLLQILCKFFLPRPLSVQDQNIIYIHKVYENL